MAIVCVLSVSFSFHKVIFHYHGGRPFSVLSIGHRDPHQFTVFCLYLGTRRHIGTAICVCVLATPGLSSRKKTPTCALSAVDMQKPVDLVMSALLICSRGIVSDKYNTEKCLT